MIAAVEREMRYQVESLGSRELTRMFRNMPNGKMFRAKLVLIIAGQSVSAIRTAAVLEMIHAASLLHDDVLDEAFMRRNKPSINALYGSKAAILLGDVLYSKGYAQLAKLDAKVAETIAMAVTQLSIGEIEDVAMSDLFNTDKALYMEMIYKKTGVLIEAAAAAAAYLAGKPTKRYALYGKNLGIAFQMIDDILDITSDTQTLGKPSMHDFSEGKATLPYLYLYEAANRQEREQLLGMFKKPLDAEQKQWIKAKMEHYGAIARAKSEAKALIDEAIAQMRKENEPELEKIAQAMIERKF